MRKPWLLLAVLLCGMFLFGSVADAGVWVLQGQPEIIMPYQQWNDQNKWLGQIFDYSTGHVVYGFYHPDAQKYWSKERSSWSPPPGQLASEEVFSVQLSSSTMTAGLNGAVGTDVSAAFIGRTSMPDVVGQIRAGSGTFNFTARASRGSSGGKMILEFNPYFSSMNGKFVVRYHYAWSESGGGGGSTGVEQPVYSNGNDYAVSNRGMPSFFTLNQATRITYLLTYHWNGGNGAPGGGNIVILGQNGQRYGPWDVEVVNRVYWVVNPNTVLPPGRYEVRDSEPSTWSTNSQSNWQGHTIIKGIPQ